MGGSAISNFVKASQSKRNNAKKRCILRRFVPNALSLKQEALTPKHTVRVRVKQRIKAAKNFSRALCQGKCFCKTDESTVTLS